MASNGMINFKVFLHDGELTDIRRFTVDDVSVITNFMFMKEKLQMVFPALQNTVFKITWRDADGDDITITSDEDLITAFTEMDGNLKILHMTILEKNDPIFSVHVEEEEEMPFVGTDMRRIICDACNTTITGFRYKCMQCPDYDLCSNCEHKGLHSEHVMMRSSQLDMFTPRCGRRFMSHVMRSFKKAQAAAAKEANRTAKHAYRAFRHQDKEEPKTCGAFAGAAAGASASAGLGTSTKPTPQASAKPEETRDQDMFGGACAMQNLASFVAPFINAAFPTVAQPTAASSNPTAEEGRLPYPPSPLADLVRGAVNSFFEGMATAQHHFPQTPQQGKQQQEGEKSQEKSGSNAQNSNEANKVPPNTPAQVPQSPKLYPEVPSKESAPQYIPNPVMSGSAPGSTPGSGSGAATPMEVETGAQPNPPEVILVDLLESPVRPAEPGWTFVNPLNQEQTEQTAEKPQGSNGINKPSGVADPQNLKIAEGVKQLLEMGFSHELNLVALLKRFDGNVGLVVKYLFENNP